jgi:hypothetical protein
MSKLSERLAENQIDKLISLKEDQIRESQEQTSHYKLELLALQLLKMKAGFSATDKLWNEFMAYVDSENVELSRILKRAVVLSLAPGKLSLRARDIDQELLLLYREQIEQLLLKHFEVNFSLSVHDDDD